MLKKKIYLLILLAATGKTFAQNTKPVRDYVQKTDVQHQWLGQYQKFLAIPNVLGDSANMIRNAEFIQTLLHDLGVTTELLHSGKRGSAPAVFGEVKPAVAGPTIIFYAHYDGQPVNPKQWAEGLAPFTPALFTERLDRGGVKIQSIDFKNPINPQWRLYGRGSSDDKAGVFAILKAYETLLKTKQKPTVNIKFFFEGEEEAGSVNLGEIFIRHRNKLSSDLWVICDGPRHVSGKKQVVFGVRGDVNVHLNVYASKRPLHSGNYGNWAPNPAMRLAQLLASMKDGNGNVLIDGFYDDVTPLSESEKQAISKIPAIETILQDELALGRPDGGGKSFMELINTPINGMASGNVGSMASNIIPTEASAVIDLRLVAGNDVDRQVKKLADHIVKQGYTIIDHEPTDAERRQYPLLVKLVKKAGGYNAQRTPMNLPLGQKVCLAVESTVNYEIIRVPSLGGSLPLYLFEQILNARPITIPIVNYDNNQHAENENVMLQYLWEGIETMAAIMQIK